MCEGGLDRGGHPAAASHPPGTGAIQTEEVIRVAISVSAILLLAIVLIVLLRSGSLKAGPGIVAVLFGFFLASTGASDQINDILNSLADTIASIKF